MLRDYATLPLSQGLGTLLRRPSAHEELGPAAPYGTSGAASTAQS